MNDPKHELDSVYSAYQPDLTPAEVERIFSHEEATQAVDTMIKSIAEYEEIMEAIKPLFFTLSKLLYGDNDQPVQLTKLVEDAVNLLKPRLEEEVQ